jgi:drug/metabolite transporter (DMT)-like permease
MNICRRHDRSHGRAAKAGLYFSALERMDASLLALILYIYPALVLIGAVAVGRERASARRLTALLIALTGTALVLVGAASGSLDALGTAMGFGSALAYTVYILVGDRAGVGVPPIALSAFVCLGATCTFALASVMHGGPQLTFGAEGWAWVVAIAIVSTVAAILCFFAGLARVGPSAASILSTLEPVVTVALAATAFGESLGAVQVVGGALVLGAVLVMQWPARRDGRISRRANETGGNRAIAHWESAAVAVGNQSVGGFAGNERRSRTRLFLSASASERRAR